MKPFVRPTDRSAGAGRLGRGARRLLGGQAGRGGVRPDPRHQVVLARNPVGDPTCASLGEAGYRRVAVDGQQEMWVRDRVAATEATLDPVQYGHGRAVEFGERGR